MVLTLLLTVMLFLGRFLYEVFARYRTIAAVRHITAMTLATRLQAAEANRIAVLFLDMKNRRIVGWIERGTPNFRQDPEEPATQEYELPSFLVFRRALAGAGNEPDAVGFDTYNGDRTLVDRVIFQPDGTLVRPEAQNWSCPGYVDTFILWEKGVHDGQDPCAVFFGVSEADGGVGSHGAEACGVSSGV